RKARAERDVAIVLFDFPPNSGATGTAAFLAVFESLFETLRAMKGAGYDVELPENVDALRKRVLEGNAARFGTDANVVAQVSVESHVRGTTELAEIEAVWGAAPGTHQTDGRSLFVLGARFGRVLVAVQPAFGFEGDPMRLLFEGGFAPTHAFSAFYRYLRETFAADAVVHFGTHGALEFMPGKQVGLGGECWSDRLIADLPNVYLYASNNPSEGALARRRAAATLVSYLTPALTRSGLYRDLHDLREMLDRFRNLAPGDPSALRLEEAVLEKAAELELPSVAIDGVHAALLEIESSLIPQGLHVLGRPMAQGGRVETLAALGEAHDVPGRAIEALAFGTEARDVKRALAPEVALDVLEDLSRTNALLSENHELSGLLTALDGRYVRPAPGGDLLRTPAVLPTGRNLHGFDPFGLPSAFAVSDGARQVQQLLQAHQDEGHGLPRSIALVLWGADNLKSGGAPIGQAMALMGARPRFDSYGRLCGAELIPLSELGRPRIDAVMTLSGIFRDLLPLQTRMLAEAAWLAASADEPVEQNFVRAHALAYEARHGCGLEAAAVRVFSNAEGAYGANVSQLVDAGTWQDEGELAEVFARRKSFGYRRDGSASAQRELLESSLGSIDLAYQNLESVELGVTTIDHYFDTLGGISRVASKGGRQLPVYIGDQTQSEERVRTLADQVALESRTRSLNPKWAEEMLQHGAEGVRQLEAQVTNTLGWSATTGQVAPWVYTELTKTYVLDEAMRERLARLNPKASVRLAGRLLEAAERAYWEPDEAMLEALEAAGEELEDQLEGVTTRVA
ncbi:MAG: magnesium chelatase subunit H, partial [Myxococcota bacterium]